MSRREGQRQLNIWMPVEDHSAMQEAADKADKSVSAWVRDLILSALPGGKK